MQATFLNRQALYLRPDPARVIVRPFKPATEPRDLNPTDKTRANHIVDRVLKLDSKTAASLLADVLDNFEGRHRNLLETFERRANEMEEALSAHCSFSEVQRQLIGAYFMHEYSFEASALFNPSIVPHPDQSGTPAGSLRFILSLRAVGEGHVSSL
ncbi:MAG: glycosidase, partial [Bradyrhizobium sp.]